MPIKTLLLAPAFRFTSANEYVTLHRDTRFSSHETPTHSHETQHNHRTVKEENFRPAGRSYAASLRALTSSILSRCFPVCWRISLRCARSHSATPASTSRFSASVRIAFISFCRLAAWFNRFTAKPLRLSSLDPSKYESGTIRDTFLRRRREVEVIYDLRNCLEIVLRPIFHLALSKHAY